MIASLRGVLAERGPSGGVVVDVGGVGYRVTVAASALPRLPSVGDEVSFHVHHHIREDHQALYGFLRREERDCFDALLGAHGVGPSLALAILSVHAPADLVRVLADDDVAALCLVPGVGKKTAARLLVELRSRLDLAAPEAGGHPSHNAPLPGEGAEPPRLVVRRALGELGYGPEEIRAALDGLDEGDDETTLLRSALQRLAGGR